MRQYQAAAYSEDLRERQDLYFQATSERDPVRRAELMRQYQEKTREANLGLSRMPQPASAPGAAPAITPAAPPTPARSATSYNDILQTSRSIFALMLDANDGPPSP
jgi:hypothetical protein